MKRNAFSPFDDGESSGISHAPAIEGTFCAAAGASTCRTARNPYLMLYPGPVSTVSPTSAPSFNVALIVVR